MKIKFRKLNKMNYLATEILIYDAKSANIVLRRHMTPVTKSNKL